MVSVSSMFLSGRVRDVAGLPRRLAWAKEGVRVNSVHTGFVDTPILGDTDPVMLANLTPMGRLAQPEETAARSRLSG